MSGQKIIDGLNEAIAYARGEPALRAIKGRRRDMSDIVERLRLVRPSTAEDLCWLAAEEIERLRANIRINLLRWQPDMSPAEVDAIIGSDPLSALRAELAAERERAEKLRAEVSRLVNSRDMWTKLAELRRAEMLRQLALRHWPPTADQPAQEPPGAVK